MTEYNIRIVLLSKSTVNMCVYVGSIERSHRCRSLFYHFGEQNQYSKWILKVGDGTVDYSVCRVVARTRTRVIARSRGLAVSLVHSSAAQCHMQSPIRNLYIDIGVGGTSRAVVHQVEASPLWFTALAYNVLAPCTGDNRATQI